MKHILLLVLLTVGCGRADFSGTFKGTQAGSQNGHALNYNITLILSESGNNVAGNWTSTSGTTGTVTGTKDGAELKDVAMAWTGCTGKGSGTGKLDGDRLTLTGRGTFDCGGTQAIVESTFDLAKQ